MKTQLRSIQLGGLAALLAFAGTVQAWAALRADQAVIDGKVVTLSKAPAPPAPSTPPDSKGVVVLALAANPESADKEDLVTEAVNPRKDVEIKVRRIEMPEGDVFRGEAQTWLGVSTDEASEALSAQLGLDNGVGLVVNYLAADSPAAKAGLKKNDVLTQFESQWLVHPDQLRKLVRSRKPGDTVQLTYYRAGKRETVTATLAETKGFPRDGVGGWEGGMRELREQLRDLPIQENIEKHMKTLRESLGSLKVDQQKAQETLKQSLHEARRELERALAQVPDVTAALDPTTRALREIEESRILADNGASVTIRSTGNSVKSMVKSDESGTVVIVSNPEPRLTAHDKQGKLIFDGMIATPEQRKEVPKDLWERVEPLLDKMNSPEAPEER
jgi:hypothetical protein